MKKEIYLFITLLLVVAANKTSGQVANDFTYEFGVSAGGMNCITDIGGSNSDKKYYLNEIRLRNTKFTAGIYAGVMYQNFIGLRLEQTWGAVQSSDRDNSGTSENAKSKYVRNLSFRSSISELSLLAEFHPLLLFKNGDNQPKISPYILTGVSRYHFNPQAELNNRLIDLVPLHTEGEGFPEYNVSQYKTDQFNVPAGLGAKYELSESFNLRLEFVHRFLFTDYLDDVSSRDYINPQSFQDHLNTIEAAYASQLYNRSLNGKIPARRGNPKYKDSYLTLSVKLGLVIGRRVSILRGNLNPRRI